MKKLTTRFIVIFMGLDLVFCPLIIFAVLQLLGAQHRADGASIMTAFLLLKLGVCAWRISSWLRPYEDFAGEQRQARRVELVQGADAVLQALPRRFSLFYTSTWIVMLCSSFAVMKGMGPAHFALSPQSLYAVLMLVGAIWFGAFALAFPIIVLLTSEAAGQCAIFAREQGLTLARVGLSLQSRIGFVALALGLGPMIWMVAVGYMAQVDEQGRNTELRARAWVSEFSWGNEQSPEAQALAADANEVRYVLDAAGRIVAASSAPSAAQRDLGLGLLASSPQVAASIYDRPRGRGVAFRRLPEGLTVVAVTSTPASAGWEFLLSAGIFSVVVSIWAPLCAVTLARAVSQPIERLTSAVQKIVDEGNQSKMANLPVMRNDEVGMLSERFNELLDMMRDLSGAADSIAGGDLRVQVERPGELPDAFRRMVDSLRVIVGQIRQTSVELAGAATEIFAASQEQEAAATSQSSAMTEISHTMDSLSDSAAHVSEAVSGVLSNAEQTLVTTDAMVERIEGLSNHTGRITELLDVIRDIADRSDLLALNGSLEASRAGEGGQGFALVASEMRRLAERVTASVQDVKKLVTDIRESSASTIMATEESRRLARGTTEAARQITFVSQQQRSGTEQVSQSVKDITDVVTQAAAATSQTRTSAQNLKEQADRLSGLVRKFEVVGEAV